MRRLVGRSEAGRAPLTPAQSILREEEQNFLQISGGKRGREVGRWREAPDRKEMKWIVVPLPPSSVVGRS